MMSAITPFVAALREQEGIKGDAEAEAIIDFLSTKLDLDFVEFRAATNQAYAKIARAHPELKKEIALFKEYNFKLLRLTQKAERDDFDGAIKLFDEIEKELKIPKEARELQDKLFLAVKGMMFKAKTAEQRKEYYLKLFIPTLKEFLAYLEKKGLNSKLKKEIGKLFIQDYKKYLGLFVAFLFMLATGGIAVPMIFDKWSRESKEVLGSAIGLLLVLSGAVIVLFITGVVNKGIPLDVVMYTTLAGVAISSGLLMAMKEEKRKKK